MDVKKGQFYLNFVIFLDMIEENQSKLRKSANDLLQALKSFPDKADQVIPYLDELNNQIQDLLKEPSLILQSGNKNFLNQMQLLTGNDITGEKIRVALRLSGFDPKNSFVANEISRRFGPNIKQAELVNIAQCIADFAKINIDRDAKRRKSVLLKWFEENWQKVFPYLDYVVLEDSHSPKETHGSSSIRNNINDSVLSTNTQLLNNQQTIGTQFQNQNYNLNHTPSYDPSLIRDTASASFGLNNSNTTI